MVEQMNLVEGFLEGVDVRSLLLPFTCHQCTHEHLEGVSASEFSKVNDMFDKITTEENDGEGVMLINSNSEYDFGKRSKWSLKYKRSINCRRPKGFSQRQHCKYGRK